MDEKETGLDIEQEWSKIKEMHSFTCEKVLRKAKRERNAWMREDTWRLVEERCLLKAKFIAAKRYSKKNHEVKRSCRRERERELTKLYKMQRKQQIKDT